MDRSDDTAPLRLVRAAAFIQTKWGVRGREYNNRYEEEEAACKSPCMSDRAMAVPAIMEGLTNAPHCPITYLGRKDAHQRLWRTLAVTKGAVIMGSTAPRPPQEEEQKSWARTNIASPA